MAIPGVSPDVLAVGARQAFVPIAADFVTQLVISVIKKPATWRELCLRHAFVILPAMGAVYGMYGLPELNASTVVMGCWYLAYKIVLLGILYGPSNHPKA